MAYEKVSGLPPQFMKNATETASGFYLRGFLSGSTTTLQMATDSTAGTLLTKALLNSEGYPLANPLDPATIFIPHFNVKYKFGLFPTEADADAITNAIWLVDNIESGLGSRFEGDDPDLVDSFPALITGSLDPDNEPHIEYGKTLIQAKSDKTTAGQLDLNTLGGDVQLGSGIKASGQFLSGWNAGAFGTLKLSATGPGLQTQIGEPSTGYYLEVGGGSFEATNSSFPIFDVASTTFRVTHPSATTILTRALSIPDLYSRPVTDATTPSITIDADWFGKSTEITESGVTITLDTDIGNDGDLIEFMFSDSGGGTFAFNTITVRFPETGIDQGKYVLLKKISAGNYDMIGFR